MHLEGIRVLSEKIILIGVKNSIRPCLFISCCLVLLIASLSLIFYFRIRDMELIAILWIFEVVFGLVIGGILSHTIFFNNATDYIEYKIIQETPVEFKAFSDTYEVLETEGEIFTVKFKE